jgi:hypothetical protein
MIKIPVKVGDTIYMGKFKNKKTIIKTIDEDEYGIPIINGKKACTFRLDNKIKEQRIIEHYHNLNSRLNESPDPLIFVDKHGGENVLGPETEGSYPFGIYNGEVYIGDELSYHDSLAKKIGLISSGELDYAGRMWINHGVMSLWEYPSKEEFIKYLKSLESKMNGKVSFNDKWQVEEPGEGGYGTDGNMVPLSQYIGGGRWSDEERLNHLKVGSGGKTVPPGFGSKKDIKYKSPTEPKAKARFRMGEIVKDL